LRYLIMWSTLHASELWYIPQDQLEKFKAVA
jgi:hypothetical protein